MGYAAVILFSCIVGLAFSIAPVFISTLGVFIKPIAAEFGWGRTQVASAISISSIAIAISAPIVGQLIDKHGPRKVILLSTIGLSLAIAALWFLPNSYAVYILLAAAIGIAGTGSNTFAYLSVLPAWFDAKFGLSIAIAMMGIGIGQFFTPLYADWLVSGFGWRLAYVALGLSILVVTVPNALFLLRDHPAGKEAEKKSSQSDLPGLTRAEALRMPAFWRLAASFCLITIAVIGCTVHLVPLLTDRGLTPAAAASTAASIGLSMLVARFATGFLLDYVNASFLGIVSFCGAAIGIGLLLSGQPGFPVQIGVILLGVAVGVEGDLIAYMVRRVFGMRAYGAIYGFLFSAFSIGVVLGPLLMGLSFDLSGNYAIGLKCSLALAVMSALLLMQKLPKATWKQ